MRWRGELRGIGYYELIDERGAWQLRHRKRSQSEPEGWFLYGPAGIDVVGEFMGAKLAAAQRAAETFTVRYLDTATVADSKVSDAMWAELLEADGGN